MNEKKRLIKNTGIIAIGNLSTKLVSFFLLPLYTALLSTNEYGTFDYIISISAFCVPFVSVLMDESIFRFLIDCREESEKKKIISNSLLIVFTGMIIFSAVGIPVMKGVHYRYIYYVIGYILLSVACGMVSALLRGMGRTDQYAVFNFLTGALQILLNVLFIAVFRLGLTGMLLASINARLWILFVYILKLRLWRLVDFHIIDKKLMKTMVLYSLPLIPNTVSWTIINLSDRILIMNILGSSSTGIYAISNKFPSLMDMIYGFFYQAWRESSARVMGDRSQDQFYNTIYDYLKNFMYAVVLGMTAFMPLIFKVLINGRYSSAIQYIPILMIAMYFSNMSGFYGGIFTAYKDTKIMGATTTAAAVINLAVNIVLIHKIGLYAAAVSTLLSSFAVYEYRKAKVRKYVMLHENGKKQILSIITTLVVVLLFYSGEILCIGLSCMIAGIYCIVMNWGLINLLIKTALKYRGVNS